MIFIISVTRFIGDFLLLEMLQKHPIDCKFICLVRYPLSTNPLNHIRENLTFLHL